MRLDLSLSLSRFGSRGGSATDTTPPTIIEATMSDIVGDEASLTLIVSEAGTGYITATDTATEPTPAQVAAGQDSTGAAASATDSFTVSSGVNEVEASLTLTDPDTYYLWLVVQDESGNISGVEDLGTHTVEATAFETLVADQGAYWSRTGAVGTGSETCFIFAAELYRTPDDATFHTLLNWNASTDLTLMYVDSSGELRPGVGSGMSARYTAVPSTGPSLNRVIFAVDTSAATFADGVQLYVDGVDCSASMTAQVWVQNVNPDWHVTSGVLTLLNNDLYTDRAFNGALNFLYFGIGNSVPDFSVAANREKFDPANIGSDGSGVTGSQPLVYMTGDRTDWNTGTNLGSLTGFSVNGDFSVT